MNLNKQKIKNTLIMAASVFPAYTMWSWYMESRALKKAIEVNELKYNERQAEIESLPGTQAEHDWFLETGDPEIVSEYNQNLADIKMRDNVSQELLDKYGCANNNEFFDQLDQLYYSGKSGDLQSQADFAARMSDYTNDAFFQAKTETTEQLTYAMKYDFDTSEFGTNILDALMSTFPTFLVSIAISGIVIFAVGDMLWHKKRDGKERSKKETAKIRSVKAKISKVMGKTIDKIKYCFDRDNIKKVEKMSWNAILNRDSRGKIEEKSRY